MRKRIELILISPENTIREAMSVIERGTKTQPEPPPSGIALVVEEKKLLAIVTDGDIRRALLSGKQVDEPVSTIMNRRPITTCAGESSAAMFQKVSDELLKRGAVGAKLDKIIVVDKEGCLVDVVSTFELWRDSEVGAKKVCVIGLGFVGLTLALTFAEAGFEVIGVEKNTSVCETLRNGKAHFHEKNLDPLLKKHVEKKFKIIETLDRGVADIYILCVGTPINERTNTVDYSHIESGAEIVGKVLKVGDQILLRSTVTVGTTRGRVIPILEKYSHLLVGRDFSICFAPERTVEGKALEELRNLPQVIGGYDERSIDFAVRLFRSTASTVVTAPSLEAAEMVKLINNSFRDHIFAFSNQVSLICDRLGLSTTAVINAANEGYPRDRIPKPSPGVGGICLRKDPLLFADSAGSVGVSPLLIHAARQMNASIPKKIAERLMTHLLSQQSIPVENVTIGILGLAFKGKPETSDVRGSITTDVVQALRAMGFSGTIIGHDPLVSPEDALLIGVQYTSIDEIFKKGNAVLQLTNSSVYEILDFESLLKNSSVKYFFDGWQVHQSEKLRDYGVCYDGFGTGKVKE